jgi:putative addiction module component (TIGR02574 family)
LAEVAHVGLRQEGGTLGVIFRDGCGTLSDMALPAMPPPGFDDLSPAEKIDYVQALWDRAAVHPEAVPVLDWHRNIIEERLAAHRAGQGSSRSWEEARQDLRSRLRAAQR